MIRLLFGVAGRFNARRARLTQVDGVAYSWDNNGNLLNDGQRTFTYDTADRLTSVVNADVTTQFTYNGDGDRMAQIIGGVATNYALDPTGLAQVLIETTSGQSTHYLPGLAQYKENAWNYYLPDRLGNLRQLANNTGQVTLAQNYDPFGNVLEQTGLEQSIFGYTGEQTDPTGLVYLRARYYNPSIDEFTEFADKVAADLCLHDLTWPGFAAGRHIYDTPFYNGGGSSRRTPYPEGAWSANQQVCIETLGCSGRSEINYLAQGMWGAKVGEPLPVSEAIVYGWKGVEYLEKPSEGSLKWLRWGYEYYQRYQEKYKK